MKISLKKHWALYYLPLATAVLISLPTIANAASTSDLETESAKFTESMDRCNKLLCDNPKQATVWMEKGTILRDFAVYLRKEHPRRVIEINKLKEAADCYERAADNDNDSKFANYYAGWCLKRGGILQAESFSWTLYRHRKTKARVTHEETRDLFRRAIANFKKQIQQTPENTTTLCQTALADIYLGTEDSYLGKKTSALKCFDNAMSLLDEMYKLAPNHSDISFNKGRTQMARGDCYKRFHYRRKALLCYQQSVDYFSGDIALDKEGMWGYYHKLQALDKCAEMQKKLGRARAAKETYTTALAVTADAQKRSPQEARLVRHKEKLEGLLLKISAR